MKALISAFGSSQSSIWSPHNYAIWLFSAVFLFGGYQSNSSAQTQSAASTSHYGSFFSGETELVISKDQIYWIDRSNDAVYKAGRLPTARLGAERSASYSNSFR